MLRLNTSLLGKKVRDISTNMVGRATAYMITEYGLEQYIVEPEWSDIYGSDGRLLEIGRLEEIKEEKANISLSESNRGKIFTK